MFSYFRNCENEVTTREKLIEIQVQSFWENIVAQATYNIFQPE